MIPRMLLYSKQLYNTWNDWHKDPMPNLLNAIAADSSYKILVRIKFFIWHARTSNQIAMLARLKTLFQIYKLPWEFIRLNKQNLGSQLLPEYSHMSTWHVIQVAAAIIV